MPEADFNDEDGHHGGDVDGDEDAEDTDQSGDDDDNASGYDPDEDLMRELTEEEREKVRSFLARAKENGISVTESEDGFGDWTGSSGEDDDADADEDEDSI